MSRRKAGQHQQSNTRAGSLGFSSQHPQKPPLGVPKAAEITSLPCRHTAPQAHAHSTPCRPAPAEIKEKDYLTPDGDYRVDARGAKAMMNSLMYKLSYHEWVLTCVACGWLV